MWAADGGVATYGPPSYETQAIVTSGSPTAGGFNVSWDSTVLGGAPQTAVVSLGFSASALEVRRGGEEGRGSVEREWCERYVG